MNLHVTITWLKTDQLIAQIALNILQLISSYYYFDTSYQLIELPWWLSGKNSPVNSGDMGLTPGSGRSPGEGNSNPLQYYWLGNPLDGGAWLSGHWPWSQQRVGYYLATIQQQPNNQLISNYFRKFPLKDKTIKKKKHKHSTTMKSRKRTSIHWY